MGIKSNNQALPLAQNIHESKTAESLNNILEKDGTMQCLVLLLFSRQLVLAAAAERILVLPGCLI